MLTRIYKNCFSFQVRVAGVTVTFLTFPSGFHSFRKCRDIIFSLFGHQIHDHPNILQQLETKFAWKQQQLSVGSIGGFLHWIVHSHKASSYWEISPFVGFLPIHYGP